MRFRQAILPLLAALLGALTAPARAADPVRLEMFRTGTPAAFGTPLRPAPVFVRLAPEGVTLARTASRVALSLPTAEGPLALSLERAELLRPGVTPTVTGEDGARPFDPGVTVLRGTVAGDPRSTAAITLGPAGAMGLIESGGRRWALAPVDGGLHRVAEETGNAESGAGPRCAVDESRGPNPGARMLPRARTPFGAPTGTRILCDLAVDCDYEWTATRFAGNLPAATQYVMTLFAVVSLIYERDLGTSLQFSYLNLWTTPSDPYTQSPAFNQLVEFRSWWSVNRTGVARTLAHLVSGRSLNGGYAYINVLCDDPATGFGYAVTSTEGSAVLPSNITSRDVWLIAHELGHGFGSPHTQSCFWQDAGYAPVGTLLDSCFAAEGSCYAGPTGIVPPDKGTIMSYCDQLSGGSQANVRLAFHPASIALMRQQVEAALCMGAAAVQPPTQLTATALGNAAHLEWAPSASPDVLGYEVFRSSFQLDLAPQLIGSTAGVTFDAPVPWSTFHYRVRAVRAGDASATSNEVAFSRCPLAATGETAGLTRPQGMASADFNEDGIADLAVTQNTTGRVAVLLGNGTGGVGDGTFGAPVLHVVGTAPAGIVTGDFNDDGITDLAVANVSTNNVSVLLGNGAGGTGDGTFGAATNFATSFGAVALATGDFNEDGITDLAVVNGGNASLTPLLGQGANGAGNGSFVAGTTLSSQGTGLKDLVAADIDGDGITDLVLLRNAGVRTLIGSGSAGKGSGGFLVGNSYATGATGAALAAGDLDGDGILDLAVANNLTTNLNPTLAILRGNGTGGVGNGTFGARTDYPTAPSAMSVAIADWTGDGIPDVAVGSNGSLNRVLVYPGVGNGQLLGPMPLDLGTPVRSLLAGDFDSDGVPDLATANNTAGTLTMIRTGCALELANGATVTAPDGGEIWTIPSERVITWSPDPGCPSVNVDLSRDGGANWERVATNVIGSSYEWTVTPPFSNQARIRVSNAFVPGAADLSDASFVLIPPGLLGVTPPTGVASLAIRRVAPNPVRDALGMQLALPTAEPAVLELIDVAGRRVRVERVTEAAGEVRVEWRGLRLAPGVYVLRLAQGAARVTAKVAVVG